MACSGWNEVRSNRLIVARCTKTGVKMWFVKSCIEAAQFSLDVQAVIAMRLMKIAAGGRGSGVECTRMVAEKFDTVMAAQRAGALALVKGKGVKRRRRPWSR